MTSVFRIRWACGKDIESIAAIDSQTKDSPKKRWTRKTFESFHNMDDSTILVAELGGKVIAYVAFKLTRSQIELVDIAVDMDSRRQGCGSELLERVVRKLDTRRVKAFCIVNERNVEALLFLRINGFRATGTLKDHFIGLVSGYDGVVMSCEFTTSTNGYGDSDSSCSKEG